MERRAVVRWTDPVTGVEFTQEAERLIDAASLLDDVMRDIRKSRETRKPAEVEPTSSASVPVAIAAIIWRSSDLADESRYLQFLDYSVKPPRASAKIYEISASMRSTGTDGIGPMILVVEGTLYVVTRCAFDANGHRFDGNQGTGREVAIVHLVKYRRAEG